MRSNPAIKAFGIFLAVGASAALNGFCADTNSVAPAQTNDIIPTLQIKAGQVAAKVSPMLYGLMTEEINFSYEGGLYGELIRNRTFKANPTNAVYWDIINDTKISLDTNQPLNAALNVSLKMDTSTAVKNHTVGIVNNGYWGISVLPNTTYHLSFYARGENFNGPLEVSLIHIGSTNVVKITDGSTISLDTNTMQISASTVASNKSGDYGMMADQWQLAGAEISKISKDWQKYEVTLKTGDIKPTKNNQLMISAYKGGGSFWHRHSAVWFQQISLFPPTFNNRPNGNRPDIMQLLADMNPKFLRLPGGNYLEGSTINERFDWKKTIGDISQRPGHRSPWNYWSTDGFGLLEYLNWCEDLHMEPLLAVYAGYSLRQQKVAVGDDMKPYVQDALDEIEYITGDASTTWGAQRAKDGHPAPFPLHYVEIGNEDFAERASTYDARFTQFYDAIKVKYPNLQLISTVANDQPEAKRVHSRTPDLLDEHLYPETEGAMEVRAHEFDNLPRTGPKIFVGEWATRVGSPTPDMAGALGDAAWMTGMERNSDLVPLESYAPLLVNVSELAGRSRSMQWRSDLIGYDALTSYGSPSYYAQVMFSTHHGDQVLATDAQDIPTYTYSGRGRGGQTAAPQQVPSLFFDATRDSSSGTIYLKIVNHNSTAQPVHVKISGVNNVEPSAVAIVMSAGSPDDTNSILEPKKVVPVTSTVDGLGADFTRDFPPYSITILELKTN